MVYSTLVNKLSRQDRELILDYVAIVSFAIRGPDSFRKCNLPDRGAGIDTDNLPLSLFAYQDMASKSAEINATLDMNSEE